MLVIGIGKNYVSEASEIPKDKAAPIIFTKPENTILTDNKDFKIPAISKDIAYEVELAFRIGKTAKNIPTGIALSHIDAVALAIDFTAKDVLTASREVKGPWALAKSFDDATPISQFIPLADLPKWDSLTFSLDLNGQRVQDGHASLMIHTLPEMLSLVSQFITLQPGDILLTGTPAQGVGSVKPGDRLQATLEGRQLMDFRVI